MSAAAAVVGADRRRIARRIGLILAFVVALLAGSARAADVPYLTGRVVDEAGILSPAAIEQLTAISREHELKTTNQVVVLTVPTLSGESIEEYAQRVFAAWKIGQQGKDNGVLVIVVPDDHRMRIEVGYGLEGTLPDVEAARIIRNQMTPRFKANDFDGGVIDGVSAIVAKLEGRAVAGRYPPPAQDLPAAREGQTSVSESPDVEQSRIKPQVWLFLILLGAFVFGIIGVFTVIGLLLPGFGWFIYFFLISFWVIFPTVIVDLKFALRLLTVHLIVFPIVKLMLPRTDWYRRAASELKHTGKTKVGGIVISSGGSSSGGFSDGGGGGGFSGGGGSSGGGGASGSW